MQESVVKDPALAPEGHRKIDWVAEHSPVLNSVRDKFLNDGTFDGLGVAAALAERGVTVYASSENDPEDADRELERVIDGATDNKEAVFIDDRAGLVRLAHTTRRDLLAHVRGASEETTSGVAKVRAMEREGILEFPVIAANDARCKYLF